MVYIEIYTKEGCPACDNAKQMLNENKVSFTEHLMGRDITREELKEKFPHVRTVPIILVDGQEIRDVATFKLLLEG